MGSLVVFASLPYPVPDFLPSRAGTELAACRFHGSPTFLRLFDAGEGGRRRPMILLGLDTAVLSA